MRRFFASGTLFKVSSEFILSRDVNLSKALTYNKNLERSSVFHRDNIIKRRFLVIS